MSWTHFISFHHQRQVSFLAPPPPSPKVFKKYIHINFLHQRKKTICLFTFLFPRNQKLRPLVWHNKQNNKVNPTWDTIIVKAACYTYSYIWRKTQVKDIFWQTKMTNAMTVQAQFIQQEQNIALSFLSQWSRWSQIYIYIHSTCIKKHERIYKKRWGGYWFWTWSKKGFLKWNLFELFLLT